MYYAVCFFVICLFFFFKHKTAYEMRISDWSSDVCSSDLISRYLPTAQTVASRQYEQLNRIAETSADMRQLAARSAQELAFFRDPKGPMHHLQLIEQRRYHQIEVSW